MKNTFRRALRTVAVAAAATGLLVLGAGAASAHVGVTPSNTEAGKSTLLTFATSHGCDGSPTTSVAIKIPEQITSATPTVNTGWTVEKKMVELDTPIDNGHGGLIKERVDQIVYTAVTPLPDGIRDTFVVSLRLPADAAGETLHFPTVQTCENGESAWIEIAEEGKDEPDLPAPSIVVTAADAAADVQVAGASATTPDSTNTTLIWVALAVGALGLLAGGTALLRPKKS